MPTAKAVSRRVECPTCHQIVCVRKDGTLWVHDHKRRHCANSGRLAPPVAMAMHPDNARTGEVHGYMCLIDFECELGGAEGGNTVYPSIENCMERRKCAASCGVVKVAVRPLEIVVKPTEEV